MDIHVVTNVAYEQIGMTTNTHYGEPDAIKNEAYGIMGNINNENENQEHRLMTSVVYDYVLKLNSSLHILYLVPGPSYIICVIVAILKSRNNVGSYVKVFYMWMYSYYYCTKYLLSEVKMYHYYFPSSPLYKPTLSFTI